MIMTRHIWLLILVSAAMGISALQPGAAAEGPLIGAWEEATTTGTYTPRSHAASALANNYLWVIGGLGVRPTINPASFDNGRVSLFGSDSTVIL